VNSRRQDEVKQHEAEQHAYEWEVELKSAEDESKRLLKANVEELKALEKKANKIKRRVDDVEASVI
jgi:NADPH-dependent glutamate synthase beta subunit-like oxidoreductase